MFQASQSRLIARWVAWSLLCWVTLATPLAQAEKSASVRRSGPCAECLSSLPLGTDPRPLLVLLHGDGDTAASIFEPWEASAAARGIAVLAPSCPRGEGCSARSWWRWNGSPSWLLQQINALSELRPIDRQRIWIVGWSGGGSYIGYRTQELEQTFAAIVIHGGGMPPEVATCPAAKTPVYFLVGNRNPFHELAVELRNHYQACQDEVVWTLLRGADHAAERRALAAHRAAILDWLSTKRLSESS